MTGTGGIELTFALGQPADLFAAPDTDPFSPDYDPEPVVEKLIGDVGAITLAQRRRCRLVFMLPADGGHPDGESTIPAALARHCRARIAQLRNERELLRHIGWRELWMGLGLLALCLMLSSAISGSALPPFAERLFGEGLVIAGWVVLWRPVETLIFDTGRLNREIDLLEAIAVMPASVKRSAAPARKSKKGP